MDDALITRCILGGTIANMQFTLDEGVLRKESTKDSFNPVSPKGWGVLRTRASQIAQGSLTYMFKIEFDFLSVALIFQRKRG